MPVKPTEVWPNLPAALCRQVADELAAILREVSHLIADRDGVYDPGTANGRLLLGLKGTISELELHTLHGSPFADRAVGRDEHGTPFVAAATASSILLSLLSVSINGARWRGFAKRRMFL